MTDALRDQISNLCGLFALSMTLFDRAEEEEIIKLAASAVPALAPCRVEGIYLVGDGPDRNGDRPSGELRTQLSALAGVDGPLGRPGRGWGWGYPLRGLGEHHGYLVVSAEATPSNDEQFLLRTLAHQAGAALNSAALHRREQATSEQLRERSHDLAGVNKDLRQAVSDLDRRAQIHAALMNVAATGGGAPRIAATLYQLTGKPTVVEDRFGNPLASAGGAGSKPAWPRASSARTALLNKVQRHGRPMRDADRILALAQTRGDVLGALALADPRREAGPADLFALEAAAVVLAMELSHQRSLVETELRLRGDFVDDLLAGTDDISALARAAALGHDLHPPHQVLVLSYPGTVDEQRLASAVDRAISRMTQSRPLLTRRDGKIVLIAPARKGDDSQQDWGELHRLVGAAPSAKTTAIGVGRACANPASLPRSYTEAIRALRVRENSTRRDGVTSFEDLGFYRMLDSEESTRAAGEFIQEWLGQLIDYDAKHHCDLVATMAQYFEYAGNYDATAKSLLIHRSTLRYRLRRIRELTDYDLGNVDTRLNLQIATRVWRVRGAGRP